MKIVINKCFGGFGLSDKAYSRIAELMGKKSFRYKSEIGINKYSLLKDEEDAFCVFYFFEGDEAKLNELKKYPWGEKWLDGTLEERKKYNESQELLSVPDFGDDRANPILVQVVEELGEEASGEYAKLKVVEIPDGIEWEISEYDGLESIEESHRSWS